MIRFGRAVVMCFLAVLSVAAVSPGELFPSECRALQRLVNGVPWIECATVNCTDQEACDKEFAWLQGDLWITCACQEGTPTGVACVAYWALGTPPTVICYDAGCPILQTCNQNEVGLVWGDVCACGAFEPE